MLPANTLIPGKSYTLELRAYSKALPNEPSVTTVQINAISSPKLAIIASGDGTTAVTAPVALDVSAQDPNLPGVSIPANFSWRLIQCPGRVQFNYGTAYDNSILRQFDVRKYAMLLEHKRINCLHSPYSCLACSMDLQLCLLMFLPILLFNMSVCTAIPRMELVLN